MKTDTLKLLEQYPNSLVEALATLVRQQKAPCYIAGGTVRDWLMGCASMDLDITVERDSFAWAGELARQLGGTFVPMDAEEDVARVVWQDICIDFTSFREGAATIAEDLLKRDFTINSMALLFPAASPFSRERATAFAIIDPAGGFLDLREEVIRSTGPAVFISDPLRLLRAYRFMAKYGFAIEAQTGKMIRDHVHLLYVVAGERLAAELETIMASPQSIRTIEAMHASGLLRELLPELYRGVGVQQPSSHHLDVFAHGLAALRQMEAVQRDPARFFSGCGEFFVAYLEEDRRRILLKWSALFHDLGKPATCAVRQEKNGRITFYNHDREGERLFSIIADRFRWSKKDRDFVALLIAVHMWPFHLNNARRKTGLTSKAYLRLVRAVGREYTGLFMLAMADSLAGCGPGKPAGMEADMASLFHEVDLAYRSTIEPVLAERLVSGDDLIAIFGLEPGPLFRRIFDNLEDARVEGRVKDRNQALEWIKNYLKSHK
jgi:poly(A) polymerase